MKKAFAISVAALAAFAMTGCNPTGSGSDSYPELVETEEITNGVVTKTEFEFDDKGRKISETRYVNGRMTYKIDGFEDGNNGTYRTLTRTRTNYNEDGSTSVHTLVSVFGYSTSQHLLETEYKVTDAGGAVIELKETKHNEKGVSEIKHTVNGAEILHRTDYNYDNMSGSNPYYTYKESKDGGEPVNMYFKALLYDNTNNIFTPLEYEIWAGWESDTNKGVLVEEQIEYEGKQMEIKYEFVKYDAEGNNPVKTFITHTYEMLTITF